MVNSVCDAIPLQSLGTWCQFTELCAYLALVNVEKQMKGREGGTEVERGEGRKEGKGEERKGKS